MHEFTCFVNKFNLFHTVWYISCLNEKSIILLFFQGKIYFYERGLIYLNHLIGTIIIHEDQINTISFYDGVSHVGHLLRFITVLFVCIVLCGIIF